MTEGDREQARRDRETERRAHEVAMRLRETRRNLDPDELATLVNPLPRCEAQLSPQAYLYSVDGSLNGVRLHGCLFNGELMLVYATSPGAAQDLATSGLRDTIAFLFDEYEVRVGNTEHEGGGHRARPSEPGRELERLPQMREVLETEFRKLPTKH